MANFIILKNNHTQILLLDTPPHKWWGFLFLRQDLLWKSLLRFRFLIFMSNIWFQTWLELKQCWLRADSCSLFGFNLYLKFSIIERLYQNLVWKASLVSSPWTTRFFRLESDKTLEFLGTSFEDLSENEDESFYIAKGDLLVSLSFNDEGFTISGQGRINYTTMAFGRTILSKSCVKPPPLGGGYKQTNLVLFLFSWHNILIVVQCQ